MPINKLALIRYKTIDNCLQNHYRKWTLESLVDSVSEALDEYEGIKKGVSRRTVQLDIQNMRSEKLGYNAPIIVTDKKYYSYEEKNFSITNIPVTSQDLHTLSEAVQVLRQFKGFNYFQDLSGMINKLEDKIHRQQNKGKSYIHFEKNDLLKGLEHIDPLHKAIINKKSLEISYQSFKANQPSMIIFSPYLLKEFRNRWFLLGLSKKTSIATLALDRIISINHSEARYVKSTIDVDTYYDDLIGVTKVPNQRAQLVVMKVNSYHLPYILTKPLHHTQKFLREEADGAIISIEVIWNFELERELLGFGEALTILSPRRLKNKIVLKLKVSLENYQEQSKEK